jgi:hypothetical protein
VEVEFAEEAAGLVPVVCWAQLAVATKLNTMVNTIRKETFLAVIDSTLVPTC